ncbi:MAG: hypothetical protein P4L57_04415 [Rhizomicrobium sp.]|nr:hypothetical protein [Rhizomicrobium sp.]
MNRIGIKTLGKTAFAAVLLLGTAFFTSAPAKADVGVGISFGYDGGYFSDPCDYYDYYDQAPPWGLPPDYCEYPVYFEPVYFGGSWYRGPIYYRWYGGERMYWLNGGWRRDEWRGSRPSSIRWSDRGGWHGRGGWNASGRGGWNNNDRGGWNNNGRGDNAWGRGDGGHDGWNRGADRGNWSNRSNSINSNDWNRGANRGGGNPGYPVNGGAQGGRGNTGGGYNGGGHVSQGGSHDGGGRGGWSGGNNGSGHSGQSGGQRGEHSGHGGH